MNVGERAHTDAWKAAVEAATGKPVYEWNDEKFPKDDPPGMYSLVGVRRQVVPATARATGERAVAGWTLSVRFVGATNREVLWLLERFTTAHEGQQLVALDTSPLELSFPADPPQPNPAGSRREVEPEWTYAT